MKIVPALSLLLCFASAALLAADPNEVTQTVLVGPNDPGGQVLTMKEIVRDRSGVLIRVVNHLTEQYAKETGFKLQIDEYDRNGIPVRFTMLFTDEFKAIAGFSKRVDYVTPKDELTKADFFVDDQFAFTASPDDLKAFDRYPPHRMGRYFEDNHDAALQKDMYNIESPVFGGTTYVHFLNQQQDIGPQERYLIAAWSKMHQAEGFIAVYNKRILVRESGLEIWVCFQDGLLRYLSPDLKMMIRFFYIGESIDGVTYLATFMKELREPAATNSDSLSMAF